MKEKSQNKKIVFRANPTEANFLLIAARKASINAIRENKALGLSYLITKNNQTIRENPDGSVELLPSNRPLKSSLKIKKGAILYVKS